jgi:hypothetical protein
MKIEMAPQFFRKDLRSRLFHAYGQTDGAVLIGAPQGCKRAPKNLGTQNAESRKRLIYLYDS